MLFLLSGTLFLVTTISTSSAILPYHPWSGSSNLLICSLKPVLLGGGGAFTCCGLPSGSPAGLELLSMEMASASLCSIPAPAPCRSSVRSGAGGALKGSES